MVYLLAEFTLLQACYTDEYLVPAGLKSNYLLQQLSSVLWKKTLLPQKWSVFFSKVTQQSDGYYKIFQVSEQVRRGEPCCIGHKIQLAREWKVIPLQFQRIQEEGCEVGQVPIG